jgi:hypothetical protein
MSGVSAAGCQRAAGRMQKFVAGIPGTIQTGVFPIKNPDPKVKIGSSLEEAPRRAGKGAGGVTQKKIKKSSFFACNFWPNCSISQKLKERALAKAGWTL